ncbi:MAG: radical SAM protein [Candidatus Aegiribacteria sp.]|nr:radical SAM protein [Candidatus Aegiribacteria sp.]
MPDIIIVAGGPEVTADNEWLLRNKEFDLFVSGEGEPVASEVLKYDSVINIIKTASGFLETGQMDFIPGSWPNPWLTGYLDPSEGASIHIETVRGCSGSCNYCSYRRNHPVPRILPAKDAISLLKKLSSAGAGEIVFLDPTFNNRPDLIELLEGMVDLRIDCFGEMRGDTISKHIADAIARAGFRSAEIGFQSGNPEVLRQSGRLGNPQDILDGALNLKNAGVTPVIDLMLGLPGDTPAGAIRSAGIIRDMGLHQQVQVFHLSMLPGTQIRIDSTDRFMPRPPYYRFTDMSMRGYAAAREEIADIFGYDLDLDPRPLLFDEWAGTEYIDLSTDTETSRQMPSFRHGAIRFRSENPWNDRKQIIEFVRSRLQSDPFCVLDVILEPAVEFPLDLIGLLRQLDSPIDYSGRVARVLGRQGNLRITILLADWREFKPTWIEAATGTCAVVTDEASPTGLPEEFWDTGVSVRLPGIEWNIKDLSAHVPSIHQVLFQNRIMEERWSREILEI